MLRLLCSIFFPAIALFGTDSFARSENIDISAYGPGCGGDSGGNETSYSRLTPKQYGLDSQGNKLSNGRNLVVVAAAPGDPDLKPGTCLAYAGMGKSDSCDNPKEKCSEKQNVDQQKMIDRFNQSVFYVGDRCGGPCHEKTNKAGAITHKQRIDMAMSPALCKNFQYHHANFKKIDCPEDVADKAGPVPEAQPAPQKQAYQKPVYSSKRRRRTASR